MVGRKLFAFSLEAPKCACYNAPILAGDPVKKGEYVMEIGKHPFLKIIHMLLVAVGIVLYLVLLMKYTASLSKLAITRLTVDGIALAVGFVYLTMSYKKDAAGYYKAFLWILVISQIVENVSILASYSAPAVDVLKNSINLVLVTLLAGAKDYGKAKTYVLAVALAAFNAYAVVDVILSADTFGALAGLVMWDRIGRLIMAVVAGLMVRGKYLDKAERGTT